MKVKIGEEIMVYCDSGLGTGGEHTVTDITTKYDEDTGQPFKLIWFDDWAFDSRDGRAWETGLAYYIEHE